LLGLGFTLTGADEVSDSKDSPGWPTVRGEVVQSSVVDSRPGSRRGSLTLHFQYSYKVGGRAYTSGQVRFSWSQLSQEKVRRHPRGSAVTVYYKPADPSVCVLEPGSKFPDSYGTVLLGAAALGMGLGLLAWGRARYRRYKELKEPVGSRSPR